MPRVSENSGRRSALSAAAIFGFTLLEILAVIAIVAVLLAIGFTAFKGVKERAAIGRAQAELAMLSTALEEFKRHYGDYPQTAGQSATDGATTLFHALAGNYGPRGATGGRLHGPTLLELSKFSLEQPVGDRSPDDHDLTANAFLDPWGSRYFYFYLPAGAGSNPGVRFPSLFSAGPDGRVDAMPGVPRAGAAGEIADEDMDNIYAEKPL